ncbi:sensor domain-containing phosphodiesterase [Salinarimonas soli]|uniref:EAL domain-containing protein n=1 Tax=Salinarimonas soli TaxID=1638099 RepID=A0A5B2VBF9_9HYPH|nr:EAL domain-containing protein [Salinarimonas soli]KAA2235985.1 EAL domain-containing protein [Salinarimonas soli]
MTSLIEILQKLPIERADSGDIIQEALTAIRMHLGMEIAYFSEFVDGRSVFRRVDAPGLEHLIKVGDSHDLDDIYCNHIVEGRLPELIPDTSLEPFARAMPITDAVPIGSHVSIPIRMPDGQPFGMFCCLSPRPNPTLNQRDLETMRVFAGLATKQVHTEIEDRRARSAKRDAVERVIGLGRYEMVFQPIIDLASMRTVAVEALCRVQSDPYRSPDKWFQDAADVGLGVEFELGAIRAAVACFGELPPGVDMSLNASPELIVSGRLHEVLDPEYLNRTTLEVTEHAPIGDYAAFHRALAPLRGHGVKIAIDDAGAGYSGLQQIVQVAADAIKMDMSLTRGIDGDSARRALASAMIHFARETNSSIVAEGIETVEELRTLQSLGVERGQGYLLGKPCRLSAMEPAALAFRCG